MCDICLQMKQKQKFIQTNVQLGPWPFDLIHSNTCCRFSILTKVGQVHYFLFVDDYTQWTTIYLLPGKKQEPSIPAY